MTYDPDTHACAKAYHAEHGSRIPWERMRAVYREEVLRTVSYARAYFKGIQAIEEVEVVQGRREAEAFGQGLHAVVGGEGLRSAAPDGFAAGDSLAGEGAVSPVEEMGL